MEKEFWIRNPIFWRDPTAELLAQTPSHNFSRDHGSMWQINLQSTESKYYSRNQQTFIRRSSLYHQLTAIFLFILFRIQAEGQI